MRISIRSLLSIVVCLSCVCGIVSCSKNEQPIVEPSFTILSLKVLSADSFLLKISAEEQMLTNELAAPVADDNTFTVRYTDPRQRLQLFDYYRNTVVTDTSVTYKSGLINQVTFFQDAPGAPLKWLGPPVNESLPPAGYGKISVMYTYERLPDSVKVVIDNSPLDNGAYQPTDSFVLKKGQFSRFFEARTTTNKASLRIYTATADRRQVAQVQGNQFDNMNARFSAYLFQISLSAGTIANLKGEILY